MRIDSLSLHNFKGFAERSWQFHPQFNLIVGENGTGKTSLLDALSIAIGSWLLGLRGYDSRHIRADDVQRLMFATGSTANWERQFPCTVEARGLIQGEEMTWRRGLYGEGGRTTYVDARSIKKAAEAADVQVRAGKSVILPVISYYGTGRLWHVPREQAQVFVRSGLPSHPKSRLAGYRNSVDPRLSVAEMLAWIARQAWQAFQEGGQEPAAYRAVRDALVLNVQDACDVYFDAKLGEVIVKFKDNLQRPFTNLSDGQRCMLTLVGDIAQKAATLNPGMDGNALTQTPGVVLIDELDLHLHPKWQRHVIEDLRTTFPNIQFFCTTHSPFLIQSLRSGEELLMLEGDPTANLSDLSVDEIARGIQGVARPDVGERYEEMKAVARSYLETLEKAAGSPPEKLEMYREQLAKNIAPYADNPAFQAFLEMKRAAKLGE